MSGKLYVVGTPIGNLGDISPRALKVLSDVDFIAAEDTRVTLKLLNHFGIKKPMISYFEHNKAEKGKIILDRIAGGENCAIVTDAGMPCISDPGEELVKEAHALNISVESVPGPSALITALAISGMSSGRFTFEGFLSVNKSSRRNHLCSLINEQRTMIFYEAPHKLIATLTDMLDTLGDREVALVKELTKIHENVSKTTLSQALSFYRNNPPKGEFVIILAGAKEQKQQEYSLTEAISLAKEFAEKGDSASSAAKKAADLTGFKKGEIYKNLF